MAQIVRTIDELFLTDEDLCRALGLPRGTVIVDIKRANAGYHSAKLDLAGSLVTVLRDTKGDPP